MVLLLLLFIYRERAMIKTISDLSASLGDGKYIWIYNWNVYTRQFYCIPNNNNNNNNDNNNTVVTEPIAVNLSKSFDEKYNHLILITKNLKETEKRLMRLNTNIFKKLRLVRVDNQPGHLIMRELTAKNIMNGDNRGNVLLVYCKNVKDLYDVLKINYYYFFIEAMDNYQNSVQCFFNHQRRVSGGLFESRGLFEIVSNGSGNAEEEIRFLNCNVDDNNFPSYKITAFDIETARIDCKRFPGGDTLYDYVCSVAWQTVTVKNVSRPDIYENVETTILILCDNVIDDDDNNANILYFDTEKDLLKKFLQYLIYPDAIFITGWNIIKFDYKFLLKRLIFHDMIPDYIPFSMFYKFCSLQNHKVCDIAPPWKLTIDTMQSRIKFFPRTLHINPPSNSLDITAKHLIRDNVGKLDIDIGKINGVYATIIMNNDNNKRKEEVYKYLKRLILYNIQDVELVTKLNGILQIVQILLPLSILADLNPGDCIHYNASKVGITFMKNQFQSILMAPIDYNLCKKNNNKNIGFFYPKKKSKSKEEEKDEEDDRIKGKKGTYKGATVFEPLIGVHYSNNDNVLLGSVDFASLYPNVMLTYGIIRGYVTRVTLNNYKQNKNVYESFFVPLFIPDDSKHVYLSCKDKDLVKNCPISYLCKQLIEKRKMNKKMAPTLANALKILVNSIYGLFGVNGSPLYSKIVAIMITSYGRHHLTRAKEYFTSNFDKTSVLYGDTDSLFIKCVNPKRSLYEMTDQYNNHLAQQHNLECIQLSVDGIFECIIFIRKKLYMAKLKNDDDDSSKYKLSGFPQRLQPHIFNLMIQSLYNILDLIIAYSKKSIKERNAAIIKFYKNGIFDKCIQGGGGGGVDANSYYNLLIKVNPPNSYKSKNCKHYYIGNLYEKYHKIPITDSTYISVCEVIPLVKNMCKKKSLCLCLTESFNDRLQTLNKSISMTETFCKTFDPILEIILKDGLEMLNDNDDNDYHISLKEMCEKYKENLYNQTLLKYLKENYTIFNFSNCKYQGGYTKISLGKAWPKFISEFLFNKDMRSTNHRINWIKEDEKEEEEEKEAEQEAAAVAAEEEEKDERENGLSIKRKMCQNNSNNNKKKKRQKTDIFISITLTSHMDNNNNNNNNNNDNNDNNISRGYFTQFNNSFLSFKNIKDVNIFLNKHYFNNQLINSIDGEYIKNIKKRLYVKIENEIENYRDILNLLGFIYNKKFSPMEIDNLNNTKNPFLILLPFIAIKSITNIDDNNYNNNDNNNNDSDNNNNSSSSSSNNNNNYKFAYF